MKEEVLPHVPDAWVDWDKTRIGYEIPMNRHFYEYNPPRELSDIESDIKSIEREIVDSLAEITGSNIS
jgi:type I restriction enzyme M protein